MELASINVNSNHPSSTLSSFHNEEDPSSLQAENDTRNAERVKPFLCLVVGIVAMGGLLYGLDLGTVGATYVMDGFRQHVHWDCTAEDDNCGGDTMNRDKGLISFFFGIGATIGSLVNPYFAEQYGRRPSLAFSTIAYILGGAIQAYLPTMQLLWVGRFFIGMGIGMLSMVAPVYIAECSPNHARGLFGILYDLATSLGILLGSASSIGLKEFHAGWRIAYGVGLPFAVLLLVAVMWKWIPESPRWLAAHHTDDGNDEGELARTLASLRFPEELESEMESMHLEVQEKRELGEASWKEVFSSRNMMRRRVLLGVFFFAVQQLSGLSAVMFYAPDILSTFFTDDQAIRGTVAIAALAFLATIGSAFSVDRFGRTKLLVYNGVIMVLCLVPLAVFSSVDHQGPALGWAVLVVCCIFIMSSSLSWGPALYVLCSEMFPYRTRGKATGVTTMSHWLFATVAGAVFPLASAASLTGCFLFFAVCMFLGTSVVYFWQVETTGKSFAQIDEAFLLHQPTFKRKDW